MEETTMTAKIFDAGKYLTEVNGRDYLEVKWRLLWLRTDHPDATVLTELVKHEDDLALFRAQVSIPGAGNATGWGSETASDFHDYIEKAETKALGRALAALGYGTQFCEDFDFSANRRLGRERKQGGRRAPPSEESGVKVVDAPVSERELRVVRDAARSAATEAQIKAIYAIARDKQGLDTSALDARSRGSYGCSPEELSRRQASELIDRLRQGPAGQEPAKEPATAHA
jgi:hypothetical protein